MIRIASLLLTVPLLAACASGVPEVIRTPLAEAPTVAQVRADPDRHLGRRVRWGGAIVRVHNREQDTLVEVVALRLRSDGRPVGEKERTEGRFLARIGGFVDPAVFSKGRSITVVGTLEPAAKRKIGAYPYLFPVVGVEHYYLWEPLRRRPPPPPPPWWYDPWCPDPFYPWRCHPAWW
ncbi:MAG TPA: Slp family lipoprotein [Thiotrichales bacterium]|nr:Slp family lipoprotein [Thiotrichales bacterium]